MGLTSGSNHAQQKNVLINCRRSLTVANILLDVVIEEQLLLI
jgi:hypothetical protein